VLADVRGFAIASGSRTLVNVPVAVHGKAPGTTRSDETR
jgi:hypothetical protein